MNTENLANKLQQITARQVQAQHKAVRRLEAERRARRDIRIKMQTINLFCELKLLMLTPAEKVRLMEGK